MNTLNPQIDNSIQDYRFVLPLTWGSSVGRELVVITPSTASVDTEVLFRRLADQWKTETAHISQISTKMQHSAFRSILNMGRSVVPMILKEIEREPGHWFYALNFLTGENPIPKDFTGTVEEALNLWIYWGRERYVS